MKLLDYASAGEIVQCAVAFIGVILSQREVWRNITTLLDLSGLPIGDLRRLVALKNVSVDMILAMAQGVMFLIGVVSLLLPPPHPDVVGSLSIDTELTQSVIVHLGMMVVTVLLTAVSYMKMWLDERFLRMIPPPPSEVPGA